MSKLISLHSKTYPNNFATIDDCNYDKVKNFKYNCVSISNKLYARRFTRDKENRKRLIWIFIAQDILGYKPRRGLEINFMNRNPLDNREENIRVRPHSQNIINSKFINKKTKTGYKGVSELHVRKNAKYFRTTIPRTIIFNSVQIAKTWYDVISQELYGQLACNNGTIVCQAFKDLAMKKFDELNNSNMKHAEFEAYIKLLIETYNVV